MHSIISAAKLHTWMAIERDMLIRAGPKPPAAKAAVAHRHWQSREMCLATMCFGARGFCRYGNVRLFLLGSNVHLFQDLTHS